MHHNKPDYVYLKQKELSFSNTEIIGLIQDVLKKGNSFSFETKGSSMSPFIKSLDIITIVPVASRPIKTGDIIAFAHPFAEKLVIHRVISIKADIFLVKGDNLKYNDGKVPLERILGIITKIKREGSSVRFGLGPEKYIVSLLSRIGFIEKLKWILRPIRNLIAKFIIR